MGNESCMGGTHLIKGGIKMTNEELACKLKTKGYSDYSNVPSILLDHKDLERELNVTIPYELYCNCYIKSWIEDLLRLKITKEVSE